MAELIGPKFEEGKPDYTGMGIIDTAVAKAIGTRKERGTENMDFSNMRAGPMAAPRKKKDSKADQIAKATIYTLSSFDKEEGFNYASLFNDSLNLTLKNNVTTLEKDVAKKFNYILPTRLDDNSSLNVLLDTYEKLPNDLRLQVDSNINLAKDMNWEALLEGNNLGLKYDSKKQKISGYYDVELNKNNNPINIKPSIVKDNIYNFTMLGTEFSQGDAPPIEPNIENYKNNYRAYTMAMENYQESIEDWKKNVDNKYWGIDLKADSQSDFTQATGKIKIKNVSGYVDIKKENEIEVQNLNLETFIDTKLSDRPLELYADKYIQKDKFLDEKDSETVVGGKLPIKDMGYLYAENVDSDFTNNDGLRYGLKIDKKGEIGNFDYNLLSNIDQDKNYGIDLKLNKEIKGLPGSSIGINTKYDSDKNKYAGFELKIPFSNKYKESVNQPEFKSSAMEGFVYNRNGDLVPMSEKEQFEYKVLEDGGFTINNAPKAFEFIKQKNLFNKGGRVKKASGGRVRMASGGIARILGL